MKTMEEIAEGKKDKHEEKQETRKMSGASYY
jgi:hypothetical protein